MEFFRLLLFVAEIGDFQRDVGIQEGKFAQAFRECIEFVRTIFKNRAVRHEGDGRAGFVRLAHRADDFHRGDGISFFIFLIPDFPAAFYRYFQRFAEGVHDGNPDAVQAAGHLICIFVEFSAGMENGQHHFERGPFFILMHIGRNAAPVVGHGDAAVFVDLHVDVLTESGERFVDGVVHDFVDKVMESARAYVADVHGGPAPDRFEPF